VMKGMITTTIFGAALLGASSTMAPAVAADTYLSDPPHVFIYYKIDHFGWSKNMGRFNDAAATLVVDEENPGNSSVEVVIQAASIDTNHEARDNHLRSPDFFNAEEFPEITFESTAIERKDETTGTVTGDLTIIGVTKPVTFDFVWHKPTPHFSRTDEIHTGFSAELTLNRSEWGMEKFIPGIGDEVTLFLEIEAIKQ